MKYTTTSKKSVQEVVDAIIKNSEAKDFGVTNIYNVNNMLHSKGASFPDDCQVLDISNPHYVLNLLSTSMDMSMILPSKILIYTENGETVISMIKLKQFYRKFTNKLDDVADEVEKEMIDIIESSKWKIGDR